MTRTAPNARPKWRTDPPTPQRTGGIPPRGDAGGGRRGEPCSPLPRHSMTVRRGSPPGFGPPRCKRPGGRNARRGSRRSRLWIEAAASGAPPLGVRSLPREGVLLRRDMQRSRERSPPPPIPRPFEGRGTRAPPGDFPPSGRSTGAAPRRGRIHEGAHPAASAAEGDGWFFPGPCLLLRQGARAGTTGQGGRPPTPAAVGLEPRRPRARSGFGSVPERAGPPQPAPPASSSPPTSASHSASERIRIPSSCARRALEPGSSPTTT